VKIALVRGRERRRRRGRRYIGLSEGKDYCIKRQTKPFYRRNIQ
jgi:hypothetical protein